VQSVTEIGDRNRANGIRFLASLVYGRVVELVEDEAKTPKVVKMMGYI